MGTEVHIFARYSFCKCEDLGLWSHAICHSGFVAGMQTVELKSIAKTHDAAIALVMVMKTMAGTFACELHNK